MIVLMIRCRLDNTLPLYSQAWASEDLFPLEVFPSLLCLQCHFSGPRGRCACDTYDYPSWVFCKLVRLIHVSIFHPFLSLSSLSSAISYPSQPSPTSLFLFLSPHSLCFLPPCSSPPHPPSFSYFINLILLHPFTYLKPPLSHPLSFPHWFTFFSLSPHLLIIWLLQFWVVAFSPLSPLLFFSFHIYSWVIIPFWVQYSLEKFKMSDWIRFLT